MLYYIERMLTKPANIPQKGTECMKLTDNNYNLACIEQLTKNYLDHLATSQTTLTTALVKMI